MAVVKLSELINRLGAREWEARKKTADILVRLGDKAVPHLMSALKHENEHVVYWSIRTLGAINTPKSINPLLKLLKSKKANIRAYSAQALFRNKSENVIKALIEALDDPDWTVASNAALSLEKIGKTAKTYLIEKLKEASDNVSYWIIKILSRIDLETLKKFVQYKNKDVRLLITEALADIPTPEVINLLLHFLEDEFWTVRQNAVESLIKIGDKVIEPLLIFMKDKEADVYYWAEKVLTGLDIRMITPLIELLKKGERDIRINVARLLGKTGDERTIEPLIEALNDKCWFVAKAAANALVEIGNKVVKPVTQLLKNEDTQENVRYWAATILSRLGPEALELLIQSLKENTKQIRMLAAKALGEVKADEAIEPLVEALKDREWPVRNAAANALAAYGSRITPFIIKHVMDRNENIRMWVRRIISEVGHENVEQLLDQLQNSKDPEQRSWAACALGVIGDSRATAPLINALLNDPNDWVKKYAASALGELNDAASIEPLIKSLYDPNPEVAAYASSALGKLGEIVIEPLLAELEKDKEEIEFFIITALAEAGYEPAFEPLIDLFSDEQPYKHQRSLEAAKNCGEKIVPALIAGLKHKNWNVRNNSCKVLVNIGMPAVSAIKEALISDEKNQDLQYWGKKALREIERIIGIKPTKIERVEI